MADDPQAELGARQDTLRRYLHLERLIRRLGTLLDQTPPTSPDRMRDFLELLQGIYTLQYIQKHGLPPRVLGE